MKVLFIDFEDSFSNNIRSHLSQLESIDLSLKNYRNIKLCDFENQNIILGPGPGHPREYISYFSQKDIDLRLALLSTRRLVGICLGHQIIFNILFNCCIERSQFPMHGRPITFENPRKALQFLSSKSEELELQRYNSLYVKIDENDSIFSRAQLFFDINNELLMAYEEGSFFTMQFHPESVGTSCSKDIFQAIKGFLL